MSSPGPLPPCGHAMCALAARGAPLLPYTWVNVQSLQHSTAACRGRCAACRSLAQPPPSYSKLFEEEAPPQYNDSLVIKDEDMEAEEAAPEYHDDIVIRLEEKEEASGSNSDVIINMEEDEEEKNVRQEELSKNEEDKVSLNQDSSLLSETDQSNS